MPLVRLRVTENAALIYRTRSYKSPASNLGPACVQFKREAPPRSRGSQAPAPRLAPLPYLGAKPSASVA